MNKAKIITFVLGLKGKKINVKKAHEIIDKANVDKDEDIDFEDLIKVIIDNVVAKIFKK